MHIIGIDPGKSGGITVLYPALSEIKLYKMPAHPFGVFTLLNDFVKIETFIYLEKSQAFPKNGAVSMFNYGQHFGELIGIITALGIPYELVPPRTWTKDMFKGVNTDLSGKERASEAARRLFPKIDLRGSERSLKDHDGIVDSLLIAEWGRRQKNPGS